MTHSPPQMPPSSASSLEGATDAADCAAPAPYQPPLDLRPYLLPPLRNWWLVLLAVGLAFALGLGIVTTTEPAYEVSALVAPKSEPSSTTRQGRGLFSSLLPASAQPSFEKLKVLISSPRVLEQMQRDAGILQIIYASRWDDTKRQWRPAAEGGLKKWWRRFIGAQPPPPPSIHTLSQDLAEAIVIKGDQDFPTFTRISYEHADPQFAIWLVTELVGRADALLKKEKLHESTAQLTYLRNRLERESAQEYRQFLMELISEKDKELMLISDDGPYAIDYITSFTASERPSRPNHRKILGMFTTVGLVIGICLAFVLEGVRQRMFW